MDGRWRWMICGGLGATLLATSAGCNNLGNKGKFPEPPRASRPLEADEMPNKGPLKVETTLAFGNALLDAADPKYPRAVAERDRLLNDARKHFQTVLQQQPQNAQALAGLGRVAFYLNEPEAAVGSYRKALEVEPRNARLWFELASVQSKLQRDYAAAADSLGEAYRLEPDQLVYRRWLGRTLALSGRAEEGVALLRMNQPEAEVRFELAEMLHLLGRNDLSMQQLQMAVRVDPGFALAKEVLAEFNTPFANREIQPARYEMPVTAAPVTPAAVNPARPAAMLRTPEPLPLNAYNR